MDGLQRAMSEDGQFRVVVAVTTELTKEACRRHDLAGSEAIVLGRAMTAGCLLTTLTKNDSERVRIQLQGSGPVGRILVDSLAVGAVRGCLQRRPEQPSPVTHVAGRPTVGELVGRDGALVITRDLGLEHQYQGAVDVTSGEIDVDIERYLNRSEQLPSVLACAVRLDATNHVLRSAGILCQTFPGAPIESLYAVRERVHAGGLFELLMQDRSTQDLVGFALGGAPFSSVPTTPLVFRCTCGPERALSILSALGADDLDELAAEPGPTEVRCSYCGASYEVAPQSLRGLAAELRAQRS